ncbi:MAG: NAD(P)-dependent oxidoreductase [Puniceicoccales bacterium]
MVRSLPRGGVLINTARGGLLREDEVWEVLSSRTDLFAVLDVLVDEENWAQSPFARLPNVFLTSHISGSIGNECFRMGDFVVAEAERFLAGLPLQDVVSRTEMKLMA